jgi:hypothetical protein
MSTSKRYPEKKQTATYTFYNDKTVLASATEDKSSTMESVKSEQVEPV